MSRTFEVSRRRVLAGVASLGLAGAGAGAGTMALFSDRETASGNSISAGTLDLTLDGNDGTHTFLEATNIAPGKSGGSAVTVNNAGSMPGYVDIRVSSLTYHENGEVGNEANVDNTAGGDLQDFLEVRAEFPIGTQRFDWVKVANTPGEGTVLDVDEKLNPGESADFLLEWRFPSGQTVDDRAQSDSIDFALTFRLDQQSDGGF